MAVEAVVSEAAAEAGEEAALGAAVAEAAAASEAAGAAADSAAEAVVVAGAGEVVDLAEEVVATTDSQFLHLDSLFASERIFFCSVLLLRMRVNK